MHEISTFDIRALEIIRNSVSSLLSQGVGEFQGMNALFLDIAPQVYLGVKQFLGSGQELHTLDINPEFAPTFVADICDTNTQIDSDSYDAIFMTEVLEHVYEPSKAINEVFRLLKPNGKLFASSPFNFRIHGPLPDCWRISEHGWRFLLKDFCNVVIETEIDEERFLMPIHYRIKASKPA